MAHTFSHEHIEAESEVVAGERAYCCVYGLAEGKSGSVDASGKGADVEVLDRAEIRHGFRQGQSDPTADRPIKRTDLRKPIVLAGPDYGLVQRRLRPPCELQKVGIGVTDDVGRYAKWQLPRQAARIGLAEVLRPGVGEVFDQYDVFALQDIAADMLLGRLDFAGKQQSDGMVLWEIECDCLR